MKHEIPFFSKQDLDKYSNYFGKEYNSKDKKDIKIGNEIKEKFFEKTRYWLHQVVNDSRFEGSFRATWHYGSKYSNYTWAKIFIDGNKDSLIFFTIGVSLTQKAFIIKLDCQNKRPNNDKKLDKKELNRFYEYLEKNQIDWQYIYSDDWVNYDWDRLIAETNGYIKKYSQAYDEAIKYTYGKLKPKKEITYEFVNKLGEKKARKDQNYDNLRGKKTDLSSLNKERGALGKSGEEFVVEVENKEIKKSKKNKGKEVDHISLTLGDGLGYDILSYDKKGNKKYIEVKTTTGNIHTPFYLTKTEFEVSKIKENYFIYRLFDFDFLENSAKIQVLDKKAISELLLEPEVYKTNI